MMSLLLRLISLLCVTGSVLHVVPHLHDVVLRATWVRVIDPAALSASTLRELLDDWSVDYRHVVESSELVQMVKQLGPLDEDHVKSVQTADTTVLIPDTSFTSGHTFYRHMTSRNRSDVWLVMVVSGLNESLAESQALPDTWTSVRKRVARLGVRTGILDCTKSTAYCEVRDWVTPRFLLVIPQNKVRPGSGRESASVIIHVYKGLLLKRSVLTWVEERLQEKIVNIVSLTQLHSTWLTDYARSGHAFRAVFFTDQTTTPAFLSMVSIQYMDMVQFGVIRETDGHLLKWMKEHNVGHTFPQMLILSGDGINYVYGKAVGEYLSPVSLQNFFNMFMPPVLLQVFLILVVSFFVLPSCMGDILRFLLFVVPHFMMQLELTERRTRNMCHFVIVFMMWWGVLVPGKSLLSMALGTPFPLTAPLLTTIPMGSSLLQDLLFYTHHDYLLVICLVFACFCLDNLMLWADYVDMAPFLTGLPQVHPFFLPRSAARTPEITSVLPVTLRPVVDCLQPADQQESDDNTVNSATGSEHDSQSISETDSDNRSDNSDTDYENFNSDQSDSSEPATSRSLSDNRSDNSDTDYDNFNSDQSDSSEPATSRSLSRHHRMPTSTGAETSAPGASGTTRGEDWTTASEQSGIHARHPQSGFPVGYVRGVDCTICLDVFTNEERLLTLPCEHVYHYRCITRWLAKGNDSCPMCRKPAYQQ